MSAPKISTTMQHALDACRAAGGLWRWPGGFWVDRPCPDPKVVTSPKSAWSSAHTIKALLDRQLIEVTERAGANQFMTAVRAVPPEVTP